jgi:hypothetical protein
VSLIDYAIDSAGRIDGCRRGDLPDAERLAAANATCQIGTDFAFDTDGDGAVDEQGPGSNSVMTVSHRYQFGTYGATVTVKSADGQTATATKTVTVLSVTGRGS